MPAERSLYAKPAVDGRGELSARIRVLCEGLAAPPARSERPRLRALVQVTIRTQREAQVHHPVLSLLLRNLLADVWAEHVDTAYYARHLSVVADQLKA